MTKSPEVHIELPGDDSPGHDINYGRIDGNLLPEQSQYIVYCVQSSDGLNAHEVGHVHQRPCLEQAELAILCEKPSEL